MNIPSQSEDPDPDPTPLQQHQLHQFQNSISFDHEINPQIIGILPLQSPGKPDPAQVIADQEEREEEDESLGMVHKSNTKLSDPRNLSNRKKAVAIDKKVQNLIQLGTLIPFVPPKRFNFDKHAVLFKRLGLWDFVHIEFDEVIRDDLVGQFIISYDDVKKCCFVNGVRFDVNRSKFAKVLKLLSPMRKDKVVEGVAEAAIDSEVLEECVEFVKDFVWSWVVLRGDDWITLNEVKVWLGLIRNGHLEMVDWATLIWVMVENELKQRDQLRMCYYASHMQYFIKSQRKDLFDEESEDLVSNVTMKEEEKALSEDEINKVKLEEIKKDDDLLEEAEKEVMGDIMLLRERLQEVNEKEVKKGLHEVEVEEVKEGPHEEAVDVGVEKGAVGSLYDLGGEQDKFVIKNSNIGLALGQQDIIQKEEIKDVTGIAGEEGLEIKYERQCYYGYDNGKHFLQPCIFGEGRGYNGNEGIKKEAGQLEREVEEHVEEGKHIQEWEHMEADDADEWEGDDIGEPIEVEDDDEEEEGEDELKDGVEGNGAPNYGSVEGADLTCELPQGFQTAQPLNLKGQQPQKNSSMELFTAKAETQVMMGCISMFDKGHKRVFDYDQGTSHQDGSKRIRTDVGWDQNTSDFRFCMDQVRQNMEKAKIIYEEKSQDCNQADVNQQYLLQELQRRDSIIENLQRRKNEELQRKDREIYRLERELELHGELVKGYRETLKANRNMFSEYRKRCRLPEEPIYKDDDGGFESK